MKTKTRFHKLTAWLLTLAMLMTLVPGMTFTAFAADEVPAGSIASVTTADGETSYHNSISDAFNKAMQNSDSTLKLLDNITSGEIRIKSCSFTIDLDGKTWTSSPRALYICGTADIKIIDGSANSTGKLCQTYKGSPAILLMDSAKLEIAGGTVEHTAGGSYVVDMSASGNSTQAELIVSGGKLISNGNFVIYASGKLVKMTGGTLNSQWEHIHYKTGEIDLSEHENPAGIKLNFPSGSAPKIDALKLPSSFVLQNRSGTVVEQVYAGEIYTVCVSPEPIPGAVASVTTADNILLRYYTDITSAINAAIANTGSTLKLLDNIDAPAEINGGTFTIDLNGKTWRNSGQVLKILNDANLTIDDRSSTGNGTLYGTGTGDTATIGLYDTAVLNMVGGAVKTDGRTVIEGSGKSFKIDGGTIEDNGKIKYITGVIDLSEYNDPTGITISVQSAVLVDGNILTPVGYSMLDEDGNTVTSLEANGIYTVGECKHIGENIFSEDGICVCGSGRPAVLNGDTYEISNAGQLIWFAQEVNSGKPNINGKLTADIDLKNRAWTTICETGLYYNGYGTGTDYGYSGTFDGNGHIIKNINVSSSDSKDASCGLFGTVSGTIKNLGIEGFTFVDGGYDIRTGAIVGQLITANGKVSNCYVKGATITPGEHVTGGIAGCVYEGTIENCYVVESTISGTSDRFGHIVGDSRGDKSSTDRPGTVTNCYSDNETILSGRLGKIANCKTKSKEAFASGEVAYLLNSGVTDGTQAFYQTVGEGTPAFEGMTVYYGYESCSSKEKTYCNTEAFKIRPNHKDDDSNNICDVCKNEMHECDYTDNNGFCIRCGSYEPAVSDGNAYEISNAGQFLWFAQQVNSEGNTDANVKLMADIDLSEHGNVMIGTSSAKYRGNFDGNGKKLTVSFNTTEEYAAPFCYIDGATIQNLTVDGTIATSAKFAAGIVGSGEGDSTIEKCMVGVTINSGVNGDGTHGGLVAVVNSGTMTIDNCGFIGSITGNATNSCGGFVGWANGKATIKNSYISGTFTTETSGCNTFGRNAGNIAVSNSYYKTTYGTDNSGATQKSAEQFASGEVAHLLGEAWGQDLSDANSLPTLGGKRADCEYNNGICIIYDGCYQPATVSDKDGYYEISNAGQLFWFAKEVNSGKSKINGKLTADIDLKNKAWTPIADFSGTFDGAGYEIENFAMNISGGGDYGLFGSVKDATIKDFTISGEVESTLTAKPDEFTYGVIGDAAGNTIITDIHSYVNLTIKGEDSIFINFVGGILGRGYDTRENFAIERCSFGGTLNLGAAQVDCTGGIVAYVYAYNTVKLNNCLFDGEILSKYNSEMQVGGLMGYYKGTGLTITNALSIGDIDVNNKKFMGSLVGILREHSSANAKVKNNYYLGNQPFGNSDNGSDITDSDSTQKVELSATAVTQAQLTSGEVAYRLGEAWGQTLDTDSYPVLGGDKVYLSNGIYHNEIKEFEILSNGTDGAKATAAVAIPTAGTYTLIFADYEGTRLNKVDTVIFTVTEDKVGTIPVPSEIDITLGTNDKIMLWQDMTGINPLCEAYIVK